MNQSFKILLCLTFLSLATLVSFKPANIYADDFLEFWNEVNNNYAYFDKKHTDWNKVKTLYLPLAEKAKNKNELVSILEQAIEELYDNHFSLNTNLQSSTRLVPSGIDLWAEWIDGRAMITEVRKGFSAEQAGAKAGMEIISFNGLPIEQVVNNRIGKCIAPINKEVKDYALRQVLAGTYLTGRILEVKQQGKKININLNHNNRNLADQQSYSSLLEYRMINPSIGYIKINNSLGETALVQQFDSALLNLRATTALILDLRETPGGGNSVVARGIMSRFISKAKPYQLHVLPQDEKEHKIKRSWQEIVSPRAPFTYTKPVLLLVNHWTGSMGEGIAIGFHAIRGTKIVGTHMAGLRGAISGFQTSKTNIPYSFPTEQLYHINGTAREDFVPTHALNLADPRYNKVEDPILDRALTMIKGKTN